MKDLIYETLVSLSNQTPEQHSRIRQSLYEQLDLPFDKQLDLYAAALGPASSGKLDSEQAMNSAVESAIRLLETPEH
ncbi:PAS factor family protein [Vibrio sp. SCSIO 43140]|uniref:PAS factor family protein n=1 Tax=Vibrio sp. SCSIO 43140 TaxID=2819100 RepID=UPI002074DFBE|nr:PAS factor family protein [Vibrio sp. SCSIO 43140]USD63696.1 PAS factor family protein [Vibrio sp. SCSIO 43140]